MRRIFLFLSIIPFLFLGCSEKSNLENVELVKKFFEEAHNKQNPEIADQILSDNFIKYNNGKAANGKGPQVLKDAIKMHIKNNSSYKFKVLETVAENNSVAVKWKFESINITTGKDVKMEADGMAIFYFTEGKIEKLWQTFDLLGYFKTLGYELQPPKNE